jgi:hypothetical protein
MSASDRSAIAKESARADDYSDGVTMAVLGPKVQSGASMAIMSVRVVCVAIALLAAVAPMAAQSVTTAPADRPPVTFRLVPATIEPDRAAHSRFRMRPSTWTSRAAATPAPRRRSRAPIVGGALLGAIAGFLGGNYVQHSVCEYDCGPGGFTWGFTFAGAAGGAAIGWLFR